MCDCKFSFQFFIAAHSVGITRCDRTIIIFIFIKRLHPALKNYIQEACGTLNDNLVIGNKWLIIVHVYTRQLRPPARLPWLEPSICFCARKKMTLPFFFGLIVLIGTKLVTFSMISSCVAESVSLCLLVLSFSCSVWSSVWYSYLPLLCASVCLRLKPIYLCLPASRLA